MLGAVLAAFLTRKPPLLQAAVAGLCVGLFVATAAQANQREPSIQSTVLLVLGWGCAAAALFHTGLIMIKMFGRDSGICFPTQLCHRKDRSWPDDPSPTRSGSFRGGSLR